MSGYVVHFMVYVLAMSGLICFALFVYKRVMAGSFHPQGAKQLTIEETMSINPRKSLMIVKAGEERFLLASDVDKTTLIAKLGETETPPKITSFEKIVKHEPNNAALVKPIVKKQIEQTVKKPVKLEVITEKNPGINRTGSYTSRNYSKGKKVTLDVGKSNSHGFSTMREMAAKVNEM